MTVDDLRKTLTGLDGTTEVTVRAWDVRRRFVGARYTVQSVSGADGTPYVVFCPEEE